MLSVIIFSVLRMYYTSRFFFRFNQYDAVGRVMKLRKEVWLVVAGACSFIKII